MLQAKNVCTEQADKFRALFPHGVVLTEALCIAHASDFNFTWAAANLLSTAAQEAYEKACAPARETYNKTLAVAKKACEKACAAAWEAYDKAPAPSWEACDKACTTAWETYDKACATAWKTYQLAQAAAFFAFWHSIDASLNVEAAGEKSMTKQSIIRQGDVLIMPCKEIPADLPKVEAEGGRLILARGEATGHHHSLALSNRVTLFRDDGAGGRLYLQADAPVLLEHQEHTALTIAPGNYAVRIQRTVQSGLARRVAD
jgi:hypothetical protein